MATIIEVAKLAGVSRTTVSRFINGSGYVSEKSKKDIAYAIEELRYHPNKLAQSLHTKTSKNIALIISDIGNPIAATYAKEIERVTFAKNYSLIICNTNFDLEKEEYYVKTLLEKQIDGVIIAPSGKASKHIKELQTKGIPVVFLTRRIRGIDFDYVYFDNTDGSYKVCEHLISLNHTRIGAICRDVDYTEKHNRLKGYLMALEDYNITKDEQLISSGVANELSGYLGMESFMKLPNPPTAVYTATNLQAAGVIRYCKEHNICIPDQISLASFESFSDLDPIINPQLTANYIPIEQLARTAVEMLFERIEGVETPARTVCLSSTLKIRESSVKKI